MASNLLIANADIPLAASLIDVTSTASTAFPLTNLFGGNKTDAFELASAASGDHRITFQTSGKTANFVYLGKADRLKAYGVGTITIKGHSSNSYAGATTIQTISSFSSATLRGPDADDYILKFSTSSSYSYWFVNYNSSSSYKANHAKLFLGNYFDLGRDPDGRIVCERRRPSGAQKRAAYTYRFNWQGVSYANTVTLYNTYYRNRRHNPVILFTDTYHEALDSHRVLFGRITEMTMPPRVTDYCDVSMTFEENI